jgi:hypothetical protein
MTQDWVLSDIVIILNEVKVGILFDDKIMISKNRLKQAGHCGEVEVVDDFKLD